MRNLLLFTTRITVSQVTPCIYHLKNMCKWIKSGSTYRQTGGGNTVDTLDPGIYQVECAPMSGWYLERTGDKFVFDYKVYGVHTEIIERVMRVYPKLSGNLGILFNGLKGTGKLLLFQIICIIIVHRKFKIKNYEE